MTSKLGRDQPLFLSQNALVTTQKPWSRRQTSSRQSSQVATSISSRDLKLTRLGRNLKVMSRPQIVFPRSQHEFHVMTQDPSVLTSARSRHQKGCRDTKNDVTTSPYLAQVARVLPRSWVRAGAVVRAATHATALALRTLCPACHDPKPGSRPNAGI